MLLEDQAAYLQRIKEQAGLDLSDPKERLLSEMADTLSLLCHQIYSVGAVVDGLNETMEEFQTLLSYDFETEEAEGGDGVLGIDEYYDGAESPLYEVKCPQCGDKFAVDERSLQKGFACPSCGEKLIQAE